MVDGGVPVSEQLAEEVISLPMHAYLEPPVQDRIIDAVRRALGGLKLAPLIPAQAGSRPNFGLLGPRFRGDERIVVPNRQ